MQPDHRHTPSDDSGIIIYQTGCADVRYAGWHAGRYEVCITKPGGTYSVKVGHADALDAARRTADKLARYPREAYRFAGL